MSLCEYHDDDDIGEERWGKNGWIDGNGVKRKRSTKKNKYIYSISK
jgi:hypothetical protein